MSQLPTALIIEPSELAPHLEDKDLLIVAVCDGRVFTNEHLPGAQLVEPVELVSGQPPAVGKLPSLERLQQLFSRIGLQPDRRVIVYDDEGGGWAGRLIWTLDVIGHDNYSYLDGGLIAWLRAGLPVSSGAPAASPSDYIPSINLEPIATLDDVKASIDDPDTLVWDARSPEEYVGVRPGAMRNGHVPGAFNLDWLEVLDRDNDLRLLPPDVLRSKLEQCGAVAGKTLITHCQTHHRSGLTYLVGKVLGFDIKAYDGSWAEWGNQPDTPIETGF